MSGVVIDELVTLLNVKASGESFGAIKKMQEGLSGLVAGAAKLGAALAAAAAAGLYAAERFNRQTTELGNLAAATGISARTLQEFRYAAERVGVSSDAITKDLESLTRTMASPVIGEYNQELQYLGLNAYKSNGELKDASDLYLEIADRLNSMPPATQLQWMGKLGMSKDSLLLMKQESSGINELRKAAKGDFGVVSDATIDKARQFSIAWDKMTRIFSNVAAEISARLAPIMEYLSNKLGDFVGRHKDKIVTMFESFVNGCMTALGWIDNFVNGGDSKVGGMVGKMIEFFQTIWPTVKKVFNKIWEIVSSIIEIIVDLIYEYKDEIKAFLEVIANGLSSFSTWIANNKEVIVGFFEGIVNIVKKAAEWVMKLYENTKQLISLGKDKMDEWGVTGAIETAGGYASAIGGGIKSAAGWLFGGSEAQAAMIPGSAKGGVAGSGGMPTASSGAQMSGSTNEKVKHAMKFYKDAGLSTDEAAAIVGNIQHESGGGLDTKAWGDRNKPEHAQAHGIGQWRDDDKTPGQGRFTNLKKFAASRGTTWDDYDTQLAFVLWELQNTEKNAGNQFKSAQGVQGKTQALSQYYERPSAAHAGNASRIGFAENAAKQSQTITINQNISGNDSNAIAQKTAEKTQVALQSQMHGAQASTVQ
jgi:hypothetical protein